MSYELEVDAVDPERWDRLLQDFDDATLFQAWGYGAARWGAGRLSHALVRQDGEIIGLAQATILSVPVLGRVMAFVNFGPLWQRRSAPPDVEHLRTTMRALREEYAVRRRMCLHLRPWSHDIEAEVRSVMASEGLSEDGRSPYTTYIVDLARSEGELRAAMDKKWRANLRKAEDADLTVTQEGEREGTAIFAALHGQMRERKQFDSDFIGMLPDLFRQLPSELKPRIFVCRHGSEPVAAAIVSEVGNRAFYLNGATGERALEVRGGYFLQWAIIRSLKEGGACRWYDVYGAASSPGVRQFKKGIVGARAQEIPMPEFEISGSAVSSCVVGAGKRLREARNGLQARVSRLGRHASRQPASSSQA